VNPDLVSACCGDKMLTQLPSILFTPLKVDPNPLINLAKQIRNGSSAVKCEQYSEATPGTGLLFSQSFEDVLAYQLRSILRSTPEINNDNLADFEDNLILQMFFLPSTRPDITTAWMEVIDEKIRTITRMPYTPARTIFLQLRSLDLKKRSATGLGLCETFEAMSLWSKMELAAIVESLLWRRKWFNLMAEIVSLSLSPVQK